MLRSKVNWRCGDRALRVDRVSRHGRFPLECRQPSRGQETRRRAEGCRTTSGTRSVTDHEPGRWRGLSLDQRRATHEALTGACLVLAAHTRLLLQCVSPQMALLRRPPMSDIRLLSGVIRTWSRHRRMTEFDPLLGHRAKRAEAPRRQQQPLG